MINTNCWECKNYLGAWKCLAFPKGIPKEIQNGDNDHRSHIKDDNGIKFEPIK